MELRQGWAFCFKTWLFVFHFIFHVFRQWISHFCEERKEVKYYNRKKVNNIIISIYESFYFIIYEKIGRFLWESFCYFFCFINSMKARDFQWQNPRPQSLAYIIIHCTINNNDSWNKLSTAVKRWGK